jgi:hypothetical protein
MSIDWSSRRRNPCREFILAMMVPWQLLALRKASNTRLGDNNISNEGAVLPVLLEAIYVARAFFLLAQVVGRTSKSFGHPGSALG